MTYYTVEFARTVPGRYGYLDMVFRVMEEVPGKRRFWFFGERAPSTFVPLGEYRGTRTVWHRVPDGKRAPTWLEDLLCDAATAKEWEDWEAWAREGG